MSGPSPWVRLLTVLALAVTVTVAGGAAAETPQEKATARALFDDGRRLMKEGKLDEACPKLAESYRLSPLLSSKLNYAECLKQQGKTASAWAEYREGAAQAAKAGDDRETFARERVSELEKSLPRLTIRVSKGADVAGLEIKHDGDPVSRALLGSALPVDPGTHVIEAAAPGKMAWTSRVEIGAAGNVSVDVPILGEPTRYSEPTAPKRAPVAGPTSVEPVPVKDEGGDPGATRRYLGLGVGGAGVAAVAVGVVFGLKAKSGWDDAQNGHCDADGHCDQQGVDMVNDARGAGTIATIAVGVGVAAIAGGAILYFTAPRAEKRTALRVVPQVGAGSIGLVVGGSL